MERRKLNEEEIKAALSESDGWRAENDHLKKRFSFANFAEALAFVNRAGEIAERLDHHPDILFGWGYAEFSITTHDTGGLTAFDFALAKEIEDL